MLCYAMFDIWNIETVILEYLKKNIQQVLQNVNFLISF